jgi:hypothetical protein
MNNGAVGAAPRWTKIFERNETGAALQGAAFVNDVLRQAGVEGSYVDWAPLENPYYGCVGIAPDGTVGFIIGSGKTFTWMIDGKFTRQYFREDMRFAWPVGEIEPARQLVESIGREYP